MNTPMLFTTEEIRVPVYHGGDKPTVPQDVEPDTDISILNLNWTERQLPQELRTKHVHGLHPYLGKFIPQIVEIFARKYFCAGQTILDPFVGSGTTLVQSNELGISSVGYDISIFNILLCKAKTEVYETKEFAAEANRILKQTEREIAHQNGQMSLFGGHNHVSYTVEDNEYLQRWYAPQALRELLTYRRLLDSGNYRYADLLRIILTRSARSARLTTHFDLDFPKKPQIEPYWCYKHSRTCSPTQEALKFIQRYTKDSIRRISAFMQVRTSATVRAIHADSRLIEPPMADGIITSPPYVGLIDYHEQHAYAYHLLGLSDNSHREIGPAAAGSSESAKRQYQEDIASTFRNVSHNLPSGAPIIVVAGDRYDLYPRIAEISGFVQDAVIQRHVNRRTGRRSSEFYESVFIWRKA